MVGDRHTDGNKQQNRKRCFVCRNKRKRKLDDLCLEATSLGDGVVTLKRKRKLMQCQVCKKHGSAGMYCVTGSGNQTKCKNFHVDGCPKES
ncbi:hypothetical protein ACHAWO_001736 [Cyclotella atomus]|uniref:Uncharacterized protein n=1 Tax=Cyclotella atomus TaxID=382360 RepID=A0ABD3NFL1_9STRA